MLLHTLLIILGLGILIGAADILVRGAASLAARLRVSPLIIGLTVVSFGTSAPELTVNIMAALSGVPDLAIGNIVGSNIANIFLILGVTAMIVPLRVKSSTVWKEIPLALLAIVLLFIMGNDQLFDGLPFNALTRTDGIVLMTLLVIFLYYIFGMARNERISAKEIPGDSEQVRQYSVPASLGLTVIGLIGLTAGGRILVNAAVAIAQAAGLSEAFIGLTIVGVGTSLPELAASVVAALKKQTDIAIGNVVGSNIFNVFWILGFTSTLLQLPFSADINVDVLVAVGATLLLFLYMFVGGKRKLVRWQGATFLSLYGVYLVYLIQRG